MEEIKNECDNVKKGRCMCEEDIINDLLMCEKNISDNYALACNEMSNKHLYKILIGILNDSKNIARDLYNFAFEKGWYSVNTASESEINKAYKEYQKKSEELS